MRLIGKIRVLSGKPGIWKKVILRTIVKGEMGGVNEDRFEDSV